MRAAIESRFRTHEEEEGGGNCEALRRTPQHSKRTHIIEIVNLSKSERLFFFCFLFFVVFLPHHRDS